MDQKVNLINLIFPCCITLWYLKRSYEVNILFNPGLDLGWISCLNLKVLLAGNTLDHSETITNSVTRYFSTIIHKNEK